MFSEYADDEHQKQAEEFIMELGRFVLSFERVCDAMRYIIMFMLRDQGLSNQRMVRWTPSVGQPEGAVKL